LLLFASARLAQIKATYPRILFRRGGGILFTASALSGSNGDLGVSTLVLLACRVGVTQLKEDAKNE